VKTRFWCNWHPPDILDGDQPAFLKIGASNKDLPSLRIACAPGAAGEVVTA